MEKKTAVLIVNLGSPDSPQTGDVRRYLREFLSDPYVIDIPAVFRFLLLNLIILPLRPAKSAKAYRSVWTDRGSPLIAHTEDFTQGLRSYLSSEVLVRYCMRYGNPSINSVIAELVNRNVKKVVVAAMYPQYSEAATATVWHEVFRAMKKYRASFAVETVAPFYEQPFFLDTWTANIGKATQDTDTSDSHFLFTFHGLPERHLLKLDKEGKCLKDPDCCKRKPPYCYRSHCYATANGIASRLQLTPERFTVSFQSRLGRAKWIEPDTESVLEKLAAEGKKDVVVISPSFVADCLETLEELNIRARELFLEKGGEHFTFVPSLNSGLVFTAGFARYLRNTHSIPG